MQLVATTDFYRGLRDDEEIIRRGDTFSAKGTGIMNANERGACYLRDGVACKPEDWPKVEKKTEAGYNWAQAEIDRMRAAAAAKAGSAPP